MLAMLLALIAVVLAILWFAGDYLLRQTLKPRVFISYRRDDTGATANKLWESLTDHYGPGNAFLDREDIPYGKQYPDVLAGWLAISNVIVALVGPRWDGGIGQDGFPRILHDGDWVRHEVKNGLMRGRLLIVSVCESLTERGPKIPEYTVGDLQSWGRETQNDLLVTLAREQNLSLVKEGKDYLKGRDNLFAVIDRMHNRLASKYLGVSRLAALALFALVGWSAFTVVQQQEAQAAAVSSLSDKVTSMITTLKQVEHEQLRILQDAKLLSERQEKQEGILGTLKPVVISPVSLTEFLAIAQAKEPEKLKSYLRNYVSWTAQYIRNRPDTVSPDYVIVEFRADAGNAFSIEAYLYKPNKEELQVLGKEGRELRVVGYIATASDKGVVLSNARLHPNPR